MMLRKREGGFTIVELMVVMALSLIITLAVIEVYVVTIKFMAFMEAKSSILATLNQIYGGYRPFFYGASKAYNPERLSDGDIFNLPRSATLSSIEFYTKLKSDDGAPMDAWVLVTSTNTGYYVKIDGVCKPEKRVVVYTKLADMSFGSGDINEDTPPTWQDWRNWLSSGEAQRRVIKPLVGEINGLSDLAIIYDPYSVGSSGVNIRWRKVQVVFTVGVQQEIYDSNTCSHVVSRYPVSLYPYTVVLSLTAVNR